jgi:hypothetical protein
MLVNFQINENSWKRFKEIVGERTASEVLREFIESFSTYKDIDTISLKKELDILYKEKIKIDNTYFEIKKRYDILYSKQQKKELEELKKQQSEKEIMKEVESNTLRQNLRNIIGD